MRNCYDTVVRCYSYCCCCCCCGDDDGNGRNKHKQNHFSELASGNVHLIDTMENWEGKLSEATEDGKIVVVNFSAAWSTPCRTIAKEYCDLADKYPSMMFLTVVVDELAELSSSWEIKATPTFFFLKDGGKVDKLVGADKIELQKKTAAIFDRMSASRN